MLRIKYYTRKCTECNGTIITSNEDEEDGLCLTCYEKIEDDFVI